MNELSEKYGDKLVILAFPSNQFGHQENSNGQEIMNALKHVRPGNGFVPKCILMDKVQVNGESEHEVFRWLKRKLPLPVDDAQSLITDPKFIIWSPVRRTDIAWNFEKFLISPTGKAVKRFSKSYETINLTEEIDRLLAQ